MSEGDDVEWDQWREIVLDHILTAYVHNGETANDPMADIHRPLGLEVDLAGPFEVNPIADERSRPYPRRPGLRSEGCTALGCVG